jgi:hypothetical protein
VEVGAVGAVEAVEGEEVVVATVAARVVVLAAVVPAAPEALAAVAPALVLERLAVLVGPQPREVPEAVAAQGQVRVVPRPTAAELLTTAAAEALTVAMAGTLTTAAEAPILAMADILMVGILIIVAALIRTTLIPAVDMQTAPVRTLGSRRANAAG